MGVERFSVFCLFLLAVTGLGISQLTLTLDLPVVVEPPPSNPPNTLTFLQCIVGPPGISEDDFDTRWILPDGEIIPDDPDMGKFLVDKGGRAETDNVTIQITQLFILMLSYQDAGTYRCEVQNASLPGSPWIPASVELQLRVSLQTDEMNVTVNDTESEVELSCEMTIYIREDEDLQWFRDSQMIENSGRRTVTYRDGTPTAAQRGGDTVIPGRVAVLTISNPVKEDSGTYTCEIARTTESLDVHLSVLPAGLGVDPSTTVLLSSLPLSPGSSSSPTPQPPTSGESGDSGDDTSLGLIIGVVAGALVVAIILVLASIVVTIVIVAMYIRRKEPQPTAHIYDYVEPLDLPPRRSDTITMEDNSAYSRGGIQIHANDAYASNSQV